VCKLKKENVKKFSPETQVKTDKRYVYCNNCKYKNSKGLQVFKLTKENVKKFSPETQVKTDTRYVKCYNCRKSVVDVNKSVN
jgi:hypothetical protein